MSLNLKRALAQLQAKNSSGVWTDVGYGSSDLRLPVDLSQVLGSTLSHSNPLIVRLTDGAAFLDPRDVSDRAARLLGIVYGVAAHDSPVSGNPHLLSGDALGADYTAVDPGDISAAGDVARLRVTSDGLLQLSPLPHPNYWRAGDEWTANQTDLLLKAAPGAGLALFITDLIGSTGTAGTVLFEDGDNTRVVGRISLAANGGFVINYRTPVKMVANKSLTLTSTTVAGPLFVQVCGFTAPAAA